MKRLIALLLCLLLGANTLMLTSCSFPFGTVEPEDEPEEDPEAEREPIEIPGINNPEKYADFDLPREKLEAALAEAVKKIDFALPTFTDRFPSHNSTNTVYTPVKNDSGWNTGFWTGILWHAYELTGDYSYRNVALSRERLISEVWGYDFYGDVRTLDTHVKLLRRTLGRYSDYIVTLRGVGYRFEEKK